MPLDAVRGLLACPHCGARLEAADGTLRCDAGHAYDVARQGYVNLLPGPPPASADTPAMVAARERVLGSGAYDPVRAALDDAVGAADVVLDAGAGPGWYLHGLLDSRPDARGLALDVSLPAVRRAARRHPRLGAAVADTWRRLPVVDAAVDVVTSVFAPRNPAEFARVLRPGGRLVVLAAEPDHLEQLRSRYGLLGIEADKQQRLTDSLAADFEAVTSSRVSFTATLDPAVVADVVGMGPNAFHASTDGVPAPAEPFAVTVAVRLTVAQRRRAQVAGTSANCVR